MARLIAFLVVVGAAVGGAVWLADRPGEVIVQWLGWRVDTSVPILLLVAVILVVVIAVLLRLLAGFLRMPGLVSHFRSKRALRKGLDALADASAALFIDDARTATRKAEKARSLLTDKAPATLILARAAQAAGDRDRAAELYDMLSTDKALSGAARRGLLELAQAEGDEEKIRTLAMQAAEAHPKAAWALRAQFKALCKARDWAAAHRVLDHGRKAGAFADDERDRLTATLFCVEAQEATGKGQDIEAARLARKAVDVAPGYSPAVLLLASALAAEGNVKKAAAVLEEQWRRMPHPQVARAYLDLWKDEPALARVSHAEALAERNPEHPESRIVVARAACAAQLWGQARNRVKTLSEARPVDSRVALIMAAVINGEGGDPASANQWLKLAAEGAMTQGRPYAGWSCGSCGALSTDWQATCSNCGSFGTLGWGTGNALVKL